MVISIYGVYHLACPAKRRTPASSASYHIFGMIMDSGLIPFYVYTSWCARENFTAPYDNENRWTNIFNSAYESTDVLLYCTFLLPVVLGGLHLISIGIGLYLTILFRKIAQYPSDMNPLEDNLTSRKHQYKNSEASAASIMQKPGYMSGSTLNVNDQRFSKSSHGDRTVDFRHTRNGSEMDYSPHNPNTARMSRQMTQERDFCHGLVQGGSNLRESRQSFVQAPSARSGSPDKRDLDSFSFVGDQAGAPNPPPHTSQARSRSPRPGSSVSVRDQAAEQDHYAPTHAHMQSQQKESLLSDNWFVQDEQNNARDGDLGRPAPPSPSHRRTPNFSRPSPVGSPEPDRAGRFSPMLSPIPSDHHQSQYMPQPLRMNPPTPPNDDSPLDQTLQHQSLQHDPRHDSFQEPGQYSYTKYPAADDDDTSTIHGDHQAERQPLNSLAVNRSHTNASAQSQQSSHFAASSIYSESAPELRTANYVDMRQKSVPNFEENLHVKSVGTPQRKQYGDLASATAGIRQHTSYDRVPQEPARGYGLQADMPPSPPKHSPYGGGRVVSRTGADIADEALFVPENSSRRRYVSGKAAEEGMAGARW